MAARNIPLREARAAVAAMPDLSQAKTPTSRTAAAKRARAADRGFVDFKVSLDEDARQVLAWIKKRLGVTGAEAFRRSLVSMQREINLHDQMSTQGLDDLNWMVGLSGNHNADVIDLCVRYAAQELRKGAVVSVD